MSEFKVNPEGMAQLQKALAEAFGQAMADLDGEFDRVIEDPNEFSDLGFTDQDIVDTGRFRDSKTLNAEGNSASWNWNPTDPDTGDQYALGLYTGFLAFGRRWVPGRPWPERAIDNLDVPQKIADYLGEMGIEATAETEKLE